MSGKRAPSRSSFGPVSGFAPVRFRWSVIRTRSPGAQDGVHGAGRVGEEQGADAEPGEQAHPEGHVLGGRSPRRGGTRPCSTATGTPPSGPTTSLPAWPATVAAGNSGISSYGMTTGPRSDRRARPARSRAPSPPPGGARCAPGSRPGRSPGACEGRPSGSCPLLLDPFQDERPGRRRPGPDPPGAPQARGHGLGGLAADAPPGASPPAARPPRPGPRPSSTPRPRPPGPPRPRRGSGRPRAPWRRGRWPPRRWPRPRR